MGQSAGPADSWSRILEMLTDAGGGQLSHAGVS